MTFRVESDDPDFAGQVRFENGQQLIHAVIYQDDLPQTIDLSGWNIVDFRFRGRNGRAVNTKVEVHPDRIVLISKEVARHVVPMLHERIRGGLSIVYVHGRSSYQCSIFPIEHLHQGKSEAVQFIERYGWSMPTYGTKKSPRR